MAQMTCFCAAHEVCTTYLSTHPTPLTSVHLIIECSGAPIYVSAPGNITSTTQSMISSVFNNHALRSQLCAGEIAPRKLEPRAVE